MSDASEDGFLGCLLGLAIGDALGMAVEGWPRQRIAERYGTIDDYHLRVLADGSELKAGEFTDESEIALAIVEAMTTCGGALDVDLIGARLVHLASGESRRWMSADTLAALAAADESLDFIVALDEDAPATGEVAARGVPIGLLHAVGAFDPAALRADAERVVRLTHGSPAAIAGATAVAYGVRLAARRESSRERWAAATADFLGGGAVAEGLARVDLLRTAGASLDAVLSAIGTGSAAPEAVPTAFAAAMGASGFEESVFPVVNAGGDTDTIAAIAGALAGAAFGASGIPQRLIDGLEGRIYVSLAAPWFFRAARRRAGLLIDLRPVPPPRPELPPRQ